MQVPKRDINRMHISSVESDWSFVHVRDYSKYVRINSEIGLLITPPVSSPELTVYSIGSQIVVVIFLLNLN